MTAFLILKDGTSKTKSKANDLKGAEAVTSHEMGTETGTNLDGEGLLVGSVVYVGRGSFRMEAIPLKPPAEAGVAEWIEGAVTAPLHAAAPKSRVGNTERDTGSRPSRPRSLFGSQLDLPVLAAPTGSVGLRAPAVTMSHASLAVLIGLVLLCGVVVGTAARHLLASPAPLPIAATPVAPAPVAATAPPGPSAPTAVTAPPSPPPIVSVPAPVTIHARAKAAAKVANVVLAPRISEKAKAWVDPWAE